MHITQLLSYAVVLWCGCSTLAATYGADPDKPSEYGLAVGKKMPFHVADFVNGESRQGCPSVMISNAKSRGIIIWIRGSEDAAIRLATALDGRAVDGTKLRGFLIVFDKKEAQGLQEKAKQLEAVLVGKARSSSQAEFEGRGLDAKVQTVVFFLDQKEIKFIWSFGESELDDAKIDELVKEAGKFASESR